MYYRSLPFRVFVQPEASKKIPANLAAVPLARSNPAHTTQKQIPLITLSVSVPTLPASRVWGLASHHDATAEKNDATATANQFNGSSLALLARGTR